MFINIFLENTLYSVLAEEISWRCNFVRYYKWIYSECSNKQPIYRWFQSNLLCWKCQSIPLELPILTDYVVFILMSKMLCKMLVKCSSLLVRLKQHLTHKGEKESNMAMSYPCTYTCYAGSDALLLMNLILCIVNH